MAKIQFDIKFRPQIESGEYKVETNFGGPVEIVCWNRRDDTANKTIVGIIREGTVEEIASWNIGGKLCDAAFPQNPAYDLFLVTPEPELTEFEDAFGRALMEVPEPDDEEEWYPFLKEKAAELLALARKQLQPEIDAEIEKAYKTADEVQYRKGREEALKDLPRWKRIRDNGCVDADGDTYTDCLCILKRGWYQVISSGTKVGGELQYLSIVDLEKLPGFEEDE